MVGLQACGSSPKRTDDPFSGVASGVRPVPIARRGRFHILPKLIGVGFTIGALGLGSRFVAGGPVASGVSVGGSALSLESGLQSIGWNPANLGAQTHLVGFSITPGAIAMRNNAWDVGIIQQSLRKPPSPQEVQSLMSDVPPEGLRLRLDGNSTARLAVGPVSLGVVATANAFVSLTPDAIELIGIGREPGRHYDARGSAELAVTAAGEFTYVQAVPWMSEPLELTQVTSGVTVRFLRGLGYAKLEPTEGSTHKGDLTGLYSDRGFGIALDYGLRFQMAPTLALDASFVGLGGVRWTDLQRVTYYLPSTDQPGQSARREMAPVPGFVDWAEPRVVRYGFRWVIVPKLTLGIEHERSLNGLAAGHDRWRYGVEFGDESFPIRLGMVTDSWTQETDWSLGVGIRLGPLWLDAGIPNLGVAVGKGRAIGFGITSGLQF